MRVVQVVTQRSGGPVDHAVDVATTLAGRGHDSHVLGPLGPATARARAGGVRWHEVEVRDVRDLGGARAAARRLLGLRPDVTHLHDRRAGWVGRLLAPASTSGCVYTLHGVPDGLADLVEGNVRSGRRRRRDRWYYLHGERWITRWGRAEVVAPSTAIARYAVDHVGLPGHRVHVVPNGVDPVRYQPASRPRSGPEVVVAWVGALVPGKRPDLALAAVAATPGTRLRVAGAGPLRPALRREVARRGTADRVDLLGPVADVVPVLHDADLFLLTSRAENCPLALLQAMACGLPAVATAVGGVGELLRDDVEGRLVPPDDPVALTRALGELATDAATRRRLGAAARRRVESDHTLDACVDGLLAVYARARRCAS